MRGFDVSEHFLHGVWSDSKGYTEDLAKKVSDKGDCCMMILLDWGHSRFKITENVDDFDDEDLLMISMMRTT